MKQLTFGIILRKEAELRKKKTKPVVASTIEEKTTYTVEGTRQL